MELRYFREDDGDWKVEIVEDGKAVSGCWIVDRQMRIGSCPVRTGGIAGVGTDRRYQMQGLASRVMNGAVELMEREGYDASFLYGIQDFYHRFGYATCMPERRLYLDTRSAERAEKKGRMRRMKKGDLPQIARIYNRDNVRRTASVERDPRGWEGFRMSSMFGVDAEVRVVVDARDRVRGYVAYDAVDHRVRAAEVGGTGGDVFSTILAHLAKRAVDLRRQELSLCMPSDHPFARFCRNFGCRDSTHFERNAGPMGRIINLHAFVEKILPELSNRWGIEDRDVALAFNTDIGSGTLRWRKDKLIFTDRATGRGQVRLKQSELMLLAMGYRTATDLVAEGCVKASGKHLPLLERLFPLQQAHMWWPDRF